MDSTFTSIDYIILFVMMAISVCMGIYFGYFSKQSTATEYLLGGKSMSPWAISFSLVSSVLSGASLLMFPTETYKFGIHYGLSALCIIFVQLLTYYIYLPVFCQLRITSTYEYLELRFNNKVRVFASILNTLFMLIYLPVIIYIPAIVVALVAGVNPHIVTAITCVVCVFYTTLGGLKVVVWTDVLQFIVMFLSTLTILILGIVKAGGIENVWNLNYQSRRFELNFDLDMTTRSTVWGGAISNIVLWMNLLSIGQSSVQKYLSLASFQKVKRTICISTPAFVLTLAFAFLLGNVIYARYHDCDPVTSAKIRNINQLVPYFVLDVGGLIPGLPGLFTAGIISATLSTLSAGLNCLATTIYTDFIAPLTGTCIPEPKISLLLKMLVLTLGVICTAMVYIVEQLGDLMPVVFAIMGLTGGPLVGIFTAGMCLPIVNTKGIMAGGITSLFGMAWMILGSQWYQYKQIFKYPELPTSTEGCNMSILFNTTNKIPTNEEDILFVYRISSFHYSIIGMIIVLVVSFIVSYFTREKDYYINKDCIAPLAQFLIPHDSMIASVKVDNFADPTLNIEENFILLRSAEKK